MIYTIKKGETLEDAARELGTTAEKLAAANNTRKDKLLFPGESIYVPGGDTSGYEGAAPDPLGAVSGALNAAANLKNTEAPKEEKKSSSSTKKSSSSSSSSSQSSSSSSKTVTVTGGSTLIGGTAPASKEQTKKAADAVDDWRSRRPADYSDSYAALIDALLSELDNRSFSYDPDSDPAYTRIRGKYLTDARRAMEDAAGIAAARTGGYGNSYAQSAASQAYGRIIEGLEDVIPELYEAAYDRYSDEGDDLITRVKLLSSLSGDQWDRYNDAIKNYLSEGKMLGDLYSGLSKADTDAYLKYLSLLSK